MPLALVLLPAPAFADGGASAATAMVAESALVGGAPMACAAVVGVWLAGVGVAVGRARRLRR